MALELYFFSGAVRAAPEGPVARCTANTQDDLSSPLPGLGEPLPFQAIVGIAKKLLACQGVAPRDALRRLKKDHQGCRPSLGSSSSSKSLNSLARS